MKLPNILLVLLAAMTLSSQAADGPDILKIFDAFVVSSAAASKCEKPDQETLSRFLVNYQMVTVRTRQELKRRYPDRTDAQIDNAIKQKSKAMSERVHDVIGKQGCNDNKVQDLIRRFYFHAKWDPFNK